MPAQLQMYPFADLWHPWVFAWILLLQVAYLLAVGPWRAAFRWGPPVPTRQKVWFAIALWSVYLSEGTPLHLLSEQYLFSAHMLQHTFLTMIMSPLLILGLPVWMLRAVLRPRPVAFVFKWLTKPAPALLLFNLVYSVWHMPIAYQASLFHHWFHMVQHVILVFTALLTWWPICSQMDEFPPLPPPLKMLYIFVSGVAQIAVFGMITFAETVIYDFYAQAPRVWPGFTAQMDQVVAGAIMKEGGMGIFLLVWGIVFFKWAAAEERKTSRVIS